MASNVHPKSQPQAGVAARAAADVAGAAPAAAGAVLVDCDQCSVRGAGCPDCVVTFMLGGPPDDVRLDADERRALDVLASAGLVPPLRMVQAVDSPSCSEPP
jgi:hypothetical protein